MTQGQDRARSLGETVSTVVFLGAGLWLIGAALVGADGPVRGVLMGLCGAASLAGVARFQIAAIWGGTGLAKNEPNTGVPDDR
jgi:hypothetical protein